MGHKCTIEESIFIDIENNFLKRKHSYLSRCGYVTQEDFSIQSTKTKRLWLFLPHKILTVSPVAYS